MREIGLTRGFVAFVDDEDYEKVNRHSWCAIQGGGYRKKTYAQSNIKVNGIWKRVLMHRFILNPLPDQLIDHEDGNGLNCVKSNLRIATRGQNQHNSGPRKGRSAFKGVSWSKSANKWIAQICKDGKRRYLGLFVEEEDAAKAYDDAAKGLHGEFAKTNFR